MTTGNLLNRSLIIAVVLSACTTEIDDASNEAVPASVSYETPRGLIEEMNRLQSESCSFQCQLAIAGMYSDQFLKAQRDAVMYGISNEDTREEMIRAFFGSGTSFEELEAMTNQEFFARQLLQLDRTVPGDVVFRKVEIISEESLSETEVQIVVLHSGLEADPEYTEEGLMTFVLEQGVWKIRN